MAGTAELVNAQKNISWSFSLQPVISGAWIGFKNELPAEKKDSIRKAGTIRTALGFSVLISSEYRKNKRLYTGLQFQNFGFSRIRENLKFLDTIDPRIGIVNDLSQTGGAYVNFQYRYKYLAIPLLFSDLISDPKKKETRLHILYGTSVSALLSHDIRAVLHGFSTRGGVKEHILDNSRDEPGRFNMNLHGGFRIETRISGESIYGFAQPEIILPVFPANQGAERHRLWVAGMQVGIFYITGQNK